MHFLFTYSGNPDLIACCNEIVILKNRMIHEKAGTHGTLTESSRILGNYSMKSEWEE